MHEEQRGLAKPLWSEEASEADLAKIVAAVAQSLRAVEPFCLWLVGPLGAGKTAITGALLRSLGLAASVRVTSPTFTYVNDYQIAGAWYAHLDLYRAGAGFSAEDVGLVDSRPYRGLFVEWPTAVPDTPVLAPTHRLDIAYAQEGLARRYSFFAV